MIICFFGDSHTETEWNDDGSPALVPGLAKRFPDFQLMNKGVSGHTTRDALKRFEQDVLKHR
ncbi:MAG: esterase, partial [Thermoactinomyces sp.]